MRPPETGKIGIIMNHDQEKTDSSNKKILKTVVIIALIISAVVVLFFYFIIIFGGEECVAAGPHPRNSDVDATRCVITQEDFKEHPALEEMIVHRKRVLFSHGALLDLLVRITPGTYSFSAVHDPDSLFSERVISFEEFRALESQYSGCAYNGTVYVIVQSA